MREDSFILENRQYWDDFQKTMTKLKKKGFGKFSKEELDGFLTSYNNISGHLSYARTNFGNSPVTLYLNGLVSTAHNCIYSARTSNLKKMLIFLFNDFPSMIHEKSIFFWIAALLFIGSSVYSFIFTLISPDNAAAFIAPELIESLNFNGDSAKEWNSAIVSSLIYTNNIKVGLMAFSLGITLGLGSVVVLIQNGFMLGAIAGLAWQSGYRLDFWALILPHGILELFAIFICGAAGLIIGYSLINPGVNSRMDSFIIAGKSAIRLVIGTIPVFIIAGLIEGYITPSGIGSPAKLSFALLTMLLLLLYIWAPVIIRALRAKSDSLLM